MADTFSNAFAVPSHLFLSYVAFVLAIHRFRVLDWSHPVMKMRSSKNVCFCLLIAACCLLGNSPAQENSDAESPQQAEPNHENIAADETQRVRSMIRSVVRVLAATSEGIKTGTGFFVGNHGELITNAHVVSGANDVAVFVTSPDGKSAKLCKAHPVRMDVENDLFLVQVDGNDLPPSLPLSREAGQVLDDVIAIGFPGSLDVAISDSSKIVGGYTDSADVLENLVPNITKGAVTKVTDQRITHDAKISKGNSGGPLVNTHTDEVIGVNVAGIVDSMSTFYLAVPVKHVHNLLSRKDNIIDSIEWKAVKTAMDEEVIQNRSGFADPSMNNMPTAQMQVRTWMVHNALDKFETGAVINEKMLETIKKELRWREGDSIILKITRGSKTWQIPVEGVTKGEGNTIFLSVKDVVRLRGIREREIPTAGMDAITFGIIRKEHKKVRNEPQG